MILIDQREKCQCKVLVRNCTYTTFICFYTLLFVVPIAVYDVYRKQNVFNKFRKQPMSTYDVYDYVRELNVRVSYITMYRAPVIYCKLASFGFVCCQVSVNR